jgi:predicted nucleotidyltransferase
MDDETNGPGRAMKFTNEHKKAIAATCAELGVIRLAVFGSATRPDFSPVSDIDVVTRLDRERGNLFDRYFELKESLERLFGRPVDLVLEDSLRNPYFRKAVEQERVSLYEA